MIPLEMVRDAAVDFLGRCENCAHVRGHDINNLPLCDYYSPPTNEDLASAFAGEESNRPTALNYAARLAAWRGGLLVKESSSWYRTWLILDQPCTKFQSK